MEKLSSIIKSKKGLVPGELRAMLSKYDIKYIRRYNTPAIESINDATIRTKRLMRGKKQKTLIPNQINKSGKLFIETDEELLNLIFNEGKYKLAYYF